MCSYVVLSRILYLLKANVPQGISLMDFNRLFYNMFGHNLKPTDYKHKSLYELIECLSQLSQNSLDLVKHSTNDFKIDWLLFNENNYNKWIDGFKDELNVKMLETLVTPMLPKDVPIQNVQRMPLFSLPETGFDRLCNVVSFKATVVYICCPNELFIRLRVNDLVYKNMRKAMRFYDYEDMAEDYVLPTELLVAGYICVAQNPLDWDNWCRAIILATDGTNTVVQAIDFGNKFIVKDKNQLFLMKASIYSFPPLVIGVSMSGIAPIHFDPKKLSNCAEWSQESKQYLSQLCKRFKSSTYCIFIEQLESIDIIDRYSVLLQSYNSVLSEDIPHPIPIYFHEKLIYAGFARIISCNFNHSPQIPSIPSDVSETIEEPLLAIKCERDFDGYEAPAQKSNVENNQSLASKSKVIEINISDEKPTANGSTASEVRPIDYKKLFFTTDNSPQMKMLSLMPKVDGFPFIQRRYFIENMPHLSFPFYERQQYFTEKLEPIPKPKYSTKIGDKSDSSGKQRLFTKELAKKMFPPESLVKYFMEILEQNETTFQTRYFTEEATNQENSSTLPIEYYIQMSQPFVGNKNTNYY